MTATPFDLKLTWHEPARPGNLPPLFFLHGAWHGAWCWEAFFGFFAARGYPCAAVDLAGHGEAARPRGFDFRPVARHLPALRSAISEVGRRGRPILIAHSMGGWLAQMLVSEPDPVDALGAVLVAPVPAGGLPLATSLKLALQHPLKFTRTGLLQSFVVDNPRMARKLFHAREKPEGEVIAATAKLRPESALACMDMIFGFSRVSPRKIAPIPILLLSAEHDYFFPPRYERKNAKRLGAEYLEFQGMAHNLMEEGRWEEVAMAILRWINRVRGNGSQEARPPPRR